MSGMQTAPYQDFALKKIGYEFKNLDLLITALTHRSYVNEHKKSVTEHNERLEFLGDAVLELAVTDYLFNNFSEPEGILTSWRSSLVRTESIGEAGDALGYEPLLRMSRGEKNGSTRARQQILANAFEAVIGAVYLERGYADAEVFIKEHIVTKLDGILKSGSWRDPKSHLQEVSQRIDGQTPVYRVLEEVGPDHDKVFSLGVYVGDKLMGNGSGSSKQHAQQEAAKAALETYDKQKRA
ncbi:MAG: putative ribonuclease [Candidatus Saccharibacteria bacterium]|nr:putative ribonuclease [Candidatus Saccharibacteria bacterium]